MSHKFRTALAAADGSAADDELLSIAEPIAILRTPVATWRTEVLWWRSRNSPAPRGANSRRLPLQPPSGAASRHHRGGEEWS